MTYENPSLFQLDLSPKDRYIFHRILNISTGNMNTAVKGKAPLLRQPEPVDGYKVHKLIDSCPPLDPNSTYCNLLQCTHFASTSVCASVDEEIVGFISGYRIPERPSTLFVWQVAVAESARGIGLASSMLKNILDRNNETPITHIETTITADNAASWALFKSLANKLQTELSSAEFFSKDKHFAGMHDSEHLVQVGPIEHSRSTD